MEFIRNCKVQAISDKDGRFTLETTQDFAAATRFVRLYFSKGSSNVGVGPISITKYSFRKAVSSVPTVQVGEVLTTRATTIITYAKTRFM